MKCYIAGRIENSRKRFNIVECSLLPDDPEAYSYYTHSTPFKFRGHNLEYVGPYTVSCDHGCAHINGYDSFGTRNHGAGIGGCITPEFFEPHDKADIKPIIFNRSYNGVANADFVFVWLKDLQCYGTLVEIGIAISLKKPIIIGHPQDFMDQKDLWFAFETAEEVICDNDPANAFEKAVKYYKENYTK